MCGQSSKRDLACSERSRASCERRHARDLDIIIHVAHYRFQSAPSHLFAASRCRVQSPSLVIRVVGFSRGAFLLHVPRVLIHTLVAARPLLAGAVRRVPNVRGRPQRLAAHGGESRKSWTWRTRRTTTSTKKGGLEVKRVLRAVRGGDRRRTVRLSQATFAASHRDGRAYKVPEDDEGLALYPEPFILNPLRATTSRMRVSPVRVHQVHKRRKKVARAGLCASRAAGHLLPELEI